MAGSTTLSRFRTRLEVSPWDPMLAFCEGLAATYAGHTEEARSTFEQVARTDAGLYCSLPRAYIAALRADDSGVREIVTSKEINAWARRDKEVSWWFADCLSAVGAVDEALEWLANSIELGVIDHRFWSEIDPFVAPLREKPEFSALMKRAKEMQMRFAV
jgi:hypothetical protein